MKFCYNTNFTLPKQSQRTRSVLQDRSRSLELFWKEKTLSYNRRNTVQDGSEESGKMGNHIAIKAGLYPKAVQVYDIPNLYAVTIRF